MPFCHSYDYSRRRLHPYFPTAAAEPAFAKATFSFQVPQQLTPYRSFFRIYPSCRSSSCSHRSLHMYFPTHSLSDAAAKSASAEATFSFRCRSRARFRRSLILFQMPQQSPLPQKPHSLSDAAAEPASAEATFSSRYSSRAHFCRSHIFFQTLPQLTPPQKPFPYFPYCHSSSYSRRSLYLSLSAVKASAEANFSFKIPPQL